MFEDVPNGLQEVRGCLFGGLTIVVLEYVRLDLKEEADVGVTDAVADDLGVQFGPALATATAGGRERPPAGPHYDRGS
jgi:hypothetical protein